MSVLTRRIGEQIVLPGCEVAITVVSVAGSNVKLGVTVPQAVRIRRKELCDEPEPGNCPGENSVGFRGVRITSLCRVRWLY